MKIRKRLSQFFHGLGSTFAAAGRDPLDDRYYSTYGEETKSGQNVTVEGALAVSAVFAATRLIAETVGMIPIWMYERMQDRTKLPAFEHPLF